MKKAKSFNHVKAQGTILYEAIFRLEGKGSKNQYLLQALLGLILWEGLDVIDCWN